MKNQRRLLLPALIFILVFSACHVEKEVQKQEVFEPALEAEQTTQVTTQDIEKYDLIEGIIAPKVYQLKFEETGTIKEYKVDIGDEVTKGQVLATLDDTEIQNRIKELTKQLETLKADYDYQIAYIEKTIAAYEVEMKGLYAKLEDKNNPLEREEYSAVCKELGIRDIAIQREELKRTQLIQTYELESGFINDQLKEAREKLNRLVLKAPCDGVVVARQSITMDNTVQKDYYYVAITQKDSYYVRVDYVTQTYADRMERIYGVRNGKEYELTYTPMDKEKYAELKNSGETLYTYFEINVPDEDVLYGEPMLIKMVTSSRQNVLAVPNHAISTDSKGKYVVKQTPEGKEKVYVELGLTDRLASEIKSGLQEGDVIYVQQ